jgi:hypothetical protein
MHRYYPLSVEDLLAYQNRVDPDPVTNYFQVNFLKSVTYTIPNPSLPLSDTHNLNMQSIY